MGHAHRAAGIARRRLHEQVLEGRLADDAPVGHAVEGHAPGHAKALESRLLVDVTGHAQHDLLAHLLHGSGDVELALVHPRLRLARRAPEELGEEPVRHGEAVVVREVLHVQLEGAVVVEVDHLLHDAIEVDGLPVRREPHHLVLGAVDLEAEVVGERAVEEAQAVREADLLEEGDVRALAHAEAGGGPLAHAVHGEDGRLLERRDEEAGRGMAHVVLGEQDRPLVGPQRLPDRRRHEELLLDPDRHRLAERPERPRKRRDVRGEHPLELQERLVVEADGVELLGTDAGLAQDVLDGVGGEVRVVLLAREALFLAGGHDGAVLQEGGRGVVVEGADAEDVLAQNWCLAAASGPRGLGSCARQKDGSTSSLRSSRSRPISFMSAQIIATETK